ncbi:hypothetical protein SynBIOSE41_02444 [Synechococcus sp. BIOS-E4-1]|uniref:hypothetical protein n=1 Tax=Synechococcus sp. BIOS-E4-1 TaxID=1400864 RepID=UPI00164589E3|nr:hypothetical protein [Synechococcus sp. BIOS-E4-1]QNI54943.1 hypothetical protein SynBIOSE41_02444 [Synechococcus sp. BIOS-E4-1]
MLSTTISYEQFRELTGTFEDTVAYLCDDHLLSGEVAWTVLLCLAQAKVNEFN